MKYIWTIVLVVLMFLAVSSGVTKIMLMPQEVEFFSQYGFSNPLLIGFGAMQLLGGILLPIKKTRMLAAAVIALTFIISLVLLMLQGNIAMSVVTAIFTLLLVTVMVRSRSKGAPEF